MKVMVSPCVLVRRIFLIISYMYYNVSTLTDEGYSILVRGM